MKKLWEYVLATIGAGILALSLGATIYKYKKVGDYPVKTTIEQYESKVPNLNKYF